MSLDEKFEIAAAAHDVLEQHHAKFMQSASSLKVPIVNGAELKVVESELHATCLGISLWTHHRPIARNGELEAIEYAFLARVGNAEVFIWAMYLHPNDSLYTDPGCEDAICQSGNSYLTERIAPRLASSLLKSELFTPRK